MRCPQAKDLIEVTVDNTDHVGSCLECQNVLARQRAVISLLDEFEVPSVSLDFNRRLWQSIDSGSEARGWALMRRWLKPAIPLAAAAGLMVAAFVYDHRAVPATQHRVSASDAEKVERALDDMQLLAPFEKLEGDPAV